MGNVCERFYCFHENALVFFNFPDAYHNYGLEESRCVLSLQTTAVVVVRRSRRVATSQSSSRPRAESHWQDADDEDRSRHNAREHGSERTRDRAATSHQQTKQLPEDQGQDFFPFFLFVAKAFGVEITVVSKITFPN